jgi:hypothetical protein
MTIKRQLSGILTLFLVVGWLFFSAHGAQAGSTAEVTATVTAQNISVGLTSDGAVAFGTINLSSTKDTTTAGVNDSETAQNDGNITENFNIKAGNTAAWTLAATAAANQYTMKSCITDCDSAPTWTAVGIDPSYVTLASGVTSTSSQTFDLQVGTPTSSASYTVQTITVTIQAVQG